MAFIKKILLKAAEWLLSEEEARRFALNAFIKNDRARLAANMIIAFAVWSKQAFKDKKVTVAEIAPLLEIAGEYVGDAFNADIRIYSRSMKAENVTISRDDAQKMLSEAVPAAFLWYTESKKDGEISSKDIHAAATKLCELVNRHTGSGFEPVITPRAVGNRSGTFLT